MHYKYINSNQCMYLQSSFHAIWHMILQYFWFTTEKCPSILCSVWYILVVPQSEIFLSALIYKKFQSRIISTVYNKKQRHKKFLLVQKTVHKDFFMLNELKDASLLRLEQELTCFSNYAANLHTQPCTELAGGFH